MEGRALDVSSFARKEESAEMRVILFELIRWVTGANYHRRGAGSRSVGTALAVILYIPKLASKQFSHSSLAHIIS